MLKKQYYIYLHGFNSSPKSRKAQQFAEYVKRYQSSNSVWIPELPFAPADAISLVSKLIEQIYTQESKDSLNLVFIGSSLGGYYANYLAECYQCKAVLINPAITPYNLLQHYLGWNTNLYTGERYELSHEHIQELLDIDTPTASDWSRYLLLVQTGDETLDYREATKRFHQSPSLIVGGGDHSFQGFERVLPTIMAFAQD